MAKRKPVTRSFELVLDDLRKLAFIDGRPVLPADFERSRIRIPLHGVPEEMSEKEQSLLGSDQYDSAELEAFDKEAR